MTGLPLAAAARELGISAATLRRWRERDGCPVARRGGRGRGRAALFDVGEVRAWRERRDVARLGNDDADLERIARELPDRLGEAVAQAFRMVPQKHHPPSLAYQAAAAWVLVTGVTRDALADAGCELPPEPQPPDEIVQLQKIAQSGERF